MSKEIHLIDMRYSPYGHYLDDLKHFTFLSDEYSLSYYANGVIDDTDSRLLNYKVYGGKSTLFFLLKVYWIFLTKRKQNIVVLSASYIPLLFITLFSLNFNSSFRIHNFPKRWVQLYKFVIRKLISFSKHAVVLDFPVRDYLSDLLNIEAKRFKVVVGRPVNGNCSFPRGDKESKSVYYIGAVNQEKDISFLLKTLSVKTFPNLKFGLYGKNMSLYKSEVVKAQALNHITCDDKFFSDTEIEELYNKADYIIMPYKFDYGMRFSAILSDSVNNARNAILPKLPQFQFYNQKYGLGLLYSNSGELVDIFDRINNTVEYISFNLDVYNDYSLQRQREQVKELFL